MGRADKAWSVEQRGIEQVPVAERRGNTKELFYIWFSANIGFLGVLYGTMILAYHLSFLQGLIASLLGVSAFLLVGFLGIAGKEQGLSMLMLARRPFGDRGNVLPAFISWLNLLGWETVIWVTATDALLGLFQAVWKVQLNAVWTTVAFLGLGGCVMLIALYGHATIVKVQKWVSFVFGSCTLAVILELFSQHQVHFTVGAVQRLSAASFFSVVGLIVVGTALSWTTTASDYTRYLPPSVASFKVVGATWLGAGIPLMVMIIAGMLLTPALPGLLTASNPLVELGAGLPTFWTVLFWVTAVVGLLTENVLAIYSSGLTLQTMHIRIRRPWTATLEFLLTGVVGWHFVVSHSSFLLTLQGFLALIGNSLAPWAGVMVMDRLLVKRRSQPSVAAVFAPQTPGQWRGFGVWGLVAWIFGVLTTLLFTKGMSWDGPFTRSFIGRTNLSFVVGFFVALVIYRLGHKSKRWRRLD